MAYTIRQARQSDLAELPSVEIRAAARFRDVGLDEIADSDPGDIEFLEAVLRHGHLAVAVDHADTPVGFVEAGILDRAAHVYELSVETDHGRQGLGARLIADVESYARSIGLSAVTLSTFRDIAWNAPFYERLGFAEFARSDWSPAIHLLRKRERELGLPIERRIFMRKELG